MMVEQSPDIHVARKHDVLKDLFEDALCVTYFTRYTISGASSGVDDGAEDAAAERASRASPHERALRAILNLCQAPDVNKFVKDRHASRCHRLASAFMAEARRRVTGELMAELLMLLSITDAVEHNLAVMDAEARKRVEAMVIDKRKERDYSVLKSIKEQFTTEELDHYQMSFRELDVDKSGTIDTDEFHALFKKIGMKMSKSQVRKIISEVDVDNSGEIEFNEFLLVMKHLSEGGAKQASNLGKMLAKGSSSGLLRNVLGGKGGIMDKAQGGGFGFSFTLGRKVSMGGKLDRDAIQAAMQKQTESDQMLTRIENAKLAKQWWASEHIAFGRSRGEIRRKWQDAIEELFDRCDQDEDDLVTWREILEHFHPTRHDKDLLSRLGFIMPIDPTTPEEDMDEALSAQDKDLNLALDPHHLRGCISQLGTDPNQPLTRVEFDDQVHGVFTISRRIRAEISERERKRNALLNKNSLVDQFTTKAPKRSLFGRVSRGSRSSRASRGSSDST